MTDLTGEEKLQVDSFVAFYRQHLTHLATEPKYAHYPGILACLVNLHHQLDDVNVSRLDKSTYSPEMVSLTATVALGQKVTFARIAELSQLLTPPFCNVCRQRPFGDCVYAVRCVPSVREFPSFLASFEDQ